MAGCNSGSDQMTEEKATTTKQALKQTDPYDRIICLLPLFILLLIYGISMIFPPLELLYNYNLMNIEDGIIEWMQFLCYTIASIAGFRLFLLIRIRDNWITYGWLLFAVGCLFAAGEEISWGERLGGLNIESIRSINTQNETNIHNLLLIQNKLHISYAITGFSLALGRRVFPKLSFFPAERLTLFFLIPGLWYLAFTFYGPYMQNHQELYELLLALGLAIHAVSSLRVMQ
jgi:hypothetical protein